MLAPGQADCVMTKSPLPDLDAVIRGATAKDPDAFAELYIAFSKTLTDTIRLRFDIPTQADAEDLALDVWSRAWQAIERFPAYLPKTERTFLWWLGRFAKISVGAWRRRKTRDEGTRAALRTVSSALTRKDTIWVQVGSWRTLGPVPDRDPASVQFTAYHPKEVRATERSTLLFYMHRPDALEDVQHDAEVQLGFQTPGDDDLSRTNPDAASSGHTITVVPEVTGFRFDPPTLECRWPGRWRRLRFVFAADAASAGRHAGRLAVSIGPVLVADVPFLLLVKGGRRQTHVRPRTRVTASPYQTVFTSYARTDLVVVEALEETYGALSYKSLRDIHVLRPGEQWWPGLQRAIELADIFQLFWSASAKGSRNVRREWRHALSLRRQEFIRPVYWTAPMPSPPRELKDLNFKFIALNRLITQRSTPKP